MLCFVMFVTAVCVLFLLKLKWPKTDKSFDCDDFAEFVILVLELR